MIGMVVIEVGEFFKIYELEVIVIFTHCLFQCQEYIDIIFLTEKVKYWVVVDEIERFNKWDVLELENDEELFGEIISESDQEIQFCVRGEKKVWVIERSGVEDIYFKGWPVLVGIVSIEKSEHFSQLLTKWGIEYEVLNAKHHQREAEIVL